MIRLSLVVTIHPHPRVTLRKRDCLLAGVLRPTVDTVVKVTLTKNSFGSEQGHGVKRLASYIDLLIVWEGINRPFFY